MDKSEIWSFAKRGDVSIFKEALSTCSVAHLIQLKNSEGDSLGHIVARKGHLEFLKKLVEHGLHIDVANHKGKTLVHEATQNAQISTLKYLRSQRADFNLMTSNGDSALDLAKKPDIVSYIESVVYGAEQETMGTSSHTKKNSKAKKSKSSQLSDLKEVKRSGGVFPSDKPLERTKNVHCLSITNVSLPICQLEQVGWDPVHIESLGFPKRPDWQSLGLFSADALHSHEESIFAHWLKNVESMSKKHSVCSFERNLEYWRQLWRVLERADLCLIIVDSRNPLLHLNLSLLTHIRDEQQLTPIICLNKADLVEEEVVLAWKEYLNRSLAVDVVHCSCKDEGESKYQILECILKQSLPDGGTIQESINMTVAQLMEFRDQQNQTRKKTRRKPETLGSSCSSSESEEESEKQRKGPVCLSVIGEPNVGKSSFLNYLLGVKKVAVSSHPGRTKHLQTHLLCPNFVLCDCPGIVFPKINVPFPMQVVFGCFPIARCQDLYSVVGFLASYISPALPDLLQLNSESDNQNPLSWSVLEICETFAQKLNWMTHKGGRLDIYRAANAIVRNALAGRESIVLRYWPPESTKQ